VAADWKKKGIDVRLVGPAKEPMSRHPGLYPAALEMAQAHDVFHIHSMWESVQHQACRAAYRMGTPYVYRPSGMLDPWNMTKGTLKKKLYLALRGRTNLNRAAAIHFTSTIERDWTSRLGLKAPVIVEPLGMNFADYETMPEVGSFRAKYPQLGKRPVVMFLGRIHTGKGVELLIPALARMKTTDAILVVAGPDGDFRSEADQLIEKHGLRNRVIFTGLVKGREKIAALADATLLALPSCHENFGLVVVEAIAAGTPAVVSDQVGLWPAVKEGNVGEVVPLDVQKLADVLDEWLSERRRAERESVRARGLAWVRERYDWDMIARRWGEHYQRIVDSARRGAKAAR
jgi:glycosyltransferase involved in cell wall biosynthesis